MPIIAVAGTKGGSGKTAICSALAAEAAKTSPRVAIYDADPQKTVTGFMASRNRRKKSTNPEVFKSADTVTDAVEALAINGYDWIFLDGLPGSLLVTEEMIEVADFVIIPATPSPVGRDRQPRRRRDRRGKRQTFPRRAQSGVAQRRQARRTGARAIEELSRAPRRTSPIRSSFSAMPTRWRCSPAKTRRKSTTTSPLRSAISGRMFSIAYSLPKPQNPRAAAVRPRGLANGVDRDRRRRGRQRCGV